MKIAYLQTNLTYLNPTQNRQHATNLINTFVQKNNAPDLLILPELLNSGYFFHNTADCAKVAEPVPEGETTQWLADLSAEHGMHLVSGLAESDGERLYNSAVITGPEGYIDTYRKVHLYYEEKLHFHGGEEQFPVLELESQSGSSYRLGVMICFDWYFPEVARTLALNGADIIAHPSNLVRPNCPRAMPIRALENHVFTITANRIGKEQKGDETLTFIGQSQICSPTGETIATSTRTEEGVQAVEIDPSEARDRQITVHNHIVDDRTPHLYALK